MTEPVKEGWYEDPADRHEYRWFSAGVPTDLVKDADRTSRDAISVADAKSYESMHLQRPPDDGPLLYQDAPPPRFELLSLGQGPVAVVNTAASASEPAVYSERAGVVEIVLVILPVLVAAFLSKFLPLAAWLPLFALSLLIAVLGRWRRNRRARRFQLATTSRPGQQGS